MDYEKLKDSLDGLFAYDQGCLDSGIHDEELREKVKLHIQALPRKEQKTLIAKILVEMFLSPDAIEGGYGPEDAKEFLDWLDDEMDCLSSR